MANSNCRWHQGLCSRAFYREDDLERCPFCHRTWTLIKQRGAHSCESAQWVSDKWKREAAADLRAASDDPAKLKELLDQINAA